MVQPWVVFGTVFRSPKPFTTLRVGIELDERRRLLGDFSLLVRHVVPIDDKHMILAVHVDAAYLAGARYCAELQSDLQATRPP
jgi:hypothetical protein